MTGKIRRVLVAVEPSEPRDAAFDRALLLARGWDAELYLFHAEPRLLSRFALGGEDLEAEDREIRRSRLQGLLRAAQHEGVDARVVSAPGDPAQAIPAHAHLLMADLVVIARDYGSSRRWRSPRVAAAVSRSAPVPVLIVPAGKRTGRPLGAPFRNVVVAVDFTVASAVALRLAGDVIARRDGQGTAVHALSYAPSMVFSGGEASGIVDDLRGQLAHAETRLRGAIPGGANPRLTPRVLPGNPGQAILDVAAEVGADLVVMGVSRRHRLDELVFGSTFRRVVGRSLLPILAVPVAGGAYGWAGPVPATGVRRARLAA